MASLEERAIEILEAQIARAQAQLDDNRPSSPINFFSGLALGVVAGALLAFYFTREEAVPEDAVPRESAPILLRESTSGTAAPGAAPRPLAAMPSAPEEGVTDQLAAAEPESPEAVKELTGEAKGPGEPAPTGASAGNKGEAAATSSSAPSGVKTGGMVEPINGTCPATHPIKGNKSSMGALIYHTPASPSYARTKPESCFATEAEAEAAGYRAPRG